MSLDHPLVQALEHAVSNVTENSAEIAVFPGGADAPNMGFPCVICGLGHLEQAHGRNEYVDVSQMELACEIYLASILDLNCVKTCSLNRSGERLVHTQFVLQVLTLDTISHAGLFNLLDHRFHRVQNMFIQMAFYQMTILQDVRRGNFLFA